MSDEESQPTISEAPTGTETTATPAPSTENGLDDVQRSVLATYDKIDDFNLDELKVTIIDSGFKCLNVNKFITKDEGRLITVGAHTSHGKTAFMMQIAAHVAKEHPVIIHSFEMKRKQLITRMISSITGTPSSLIRSGMSQDPRIKKLEADFKNRKLYLSNSPNRGMSFILASVVELSKVVGRPGLVVIDYGQQVTPGGDPAQPRVNQITDISAGLHKLAMYLNCNVLVGVQLNNNILSRSWDDKDEQGKRQFVPRMDDIREGSSIAHDSDTVLVITRPGKFDRKSHTDDMAHLWAIKTRDEGEWDHKIKWDGSRCRFSEEEIKGI